MSDFNIAYTRTAKFEGGYSNDPDDKGKETYKGVARASWPNWAGWKIIDVAKTAPNFPAPLDTNQPLQDLILRFYKTNFWNHIQGDAIPDQNIANEVYDCSVNSGVTRGVTFLQQGLNVLNNNEKLYPDIMADGLFGTGTLKTLNTYLSIDNPNVLLKVMRILRGGFYLQIMSKDSTQKRFARGWLSRVVFFG